MRQVDGKNGLEVGSLFGGGRRGERSTDREEVASC